MRLFVPSLAKLFNGETDAAALRGLHHGEMPFRRHRTDVFPLTKTHVWDAQLVRYLFNFVPKILFHGDMMLVFLTLVNSFWNVTLSGRFLQ